MPCRKSGWRTSLLENARGALKRAGCTLHHDQASAVRRVGFLRDKAGVSFLASPGIAVSPLLPRGPAWRRLHAMGRLHGVAVPPRPDLSRGNHFKRHVQCPWKSKARLRSGRQPCAQRGTKGRWLPKKSEYAPQVRSIKKGQQNKNKV